MIKCHILATTQEKRPIIRDPNKKKMHLNGGIEFIPFYTKLPLPTSPRCCG